MNLVNIGIEEFKKIVYPEYVSIFPKEERKEFKVLEDNFNKKRPNSYVRSNTSLIFNKTPCSSFEAVNP